MSGKIWTRSLALGFNRWGAIFTGIATLFWMSDVVLDSLFFGKGAISGRFFPMDANELYMRGFGAMFAGVAALVIVRWNTARKLDTKIQARRNFALSEIGRIASSTLDIGDVFERVGNQIEQLLPVDRIGIAVVNPEADTFTIRYRWGENIPDRDQDESVPLDGSITGHLLKTRAVLRWPSDKATDALIPTLPGFAPVIASGANSLLSSPLIHRGRAIGALLAVNFSGGYFSERDGAIAESVAAQIASAIANAELHAQTEKNARERKILAEVGRIVSLSHDIDEVYERFCAEAMKLIPAECISISAGTNGMDNWTILFTSGLNVLGRQPGDTVSPIKGILSRTLDNASPMITDFADRAELERTLPGELPNHDAGLRSALSVRLVVESDIVGVLQFFSAETGTYGPEHLQLGEHVGNQIAGAIANTRYRVEIERRAREESILSEISRIASSTLGIEEVFAQLAELITELIPMERLSIDTIDIENGIFTVRHTWGIEVQDRRKLYEMPLAGHLAGEVIRTGGSVLINNTDDDQDLIERLPGLAPGVEAGLRAFLSVPMIFHDRVMGILAMRSSVPNAFSEAHVTIAERIADQISGTVANSRLRELAEAKAQEEEILAEIGRIVSSSLDIGDVYKAFVDQAVVLLPASRIVLNTVDMDAGKWHTRYIWGVDVPHRTPGDSGPLEGTVTDLVVRGRSPVIITDVEEMPAYLVEAGLRSVVAMPLISDDRVIGTLQFQSTDADTFSNASAELAGKIGNQIAGAIANAELHTQVERNAREENILAGIGRLVNSTLDIAEIFEAIAGPFGELIPNDRFAVYSYDDESNEWTARYTKGIEISGFRVGDHHRESYMTEQMLLLERPVLKNRDDGPDESQFSEFRRSGLNSTLQIPLVVDGKMIGMLSARSRKMSAYREEHLDLGIRVADQIAGAVANAELHAITIRDATERSVLAEIGRLVSSSLDIGTMYPSVVELIRSIVSVDRMTIDIFDNVADTWTKAFVWGVAIEGRGQGNSGPLKGSAGAQVSKLRTPIVINGMTPQDHRYTGTAPSAESGLKSAIVAPLIVRDSVIGAMHIQSLRAGAYDQSTADLTQQIGDQIAGAIANAGLHARVNRQALEETVLAGIGRTISFTLDVNEVYEAVATGVRDILPYDRMTAVEIDHDLGEFTVAYTSGAEVADWPVGATRPLHGSVVANICESRRAMLVCGGEIEGLVERFPITRDAYEKYGFPCRIFVPLVHDDRVIAILCFLGRDPEIFGKRELALAERVGAQIAGSLAHTRLYAEITSAWAELDVRAVAMETAADMIVITDRNGTIEYVNQAFVEGTGYSKDEVIGQNPKVLKSGRHDAAFYKELWDTILDGRAWTGTLINRRKDGFEYPERMTITPLQNDDGKITRFIAIKRDITNEIEAEHERELLRALDSKNRELQHLNDARIEFLSRVSHELKTPLTSIVAFSDILARNAEANFTPRQSKHIDVIRRNGERLKNLIEDLLDVSRIEDGQFAMEIDEINIRSVLKETLESLGPICDARDQMLNLDPSSGDFIIDGDVSRIAQVINNLVSNASKYSPKGSEIFLTIHDMGHEIEIIVRDQGMGISEEDQKQLFTPFFRAENKATRSVSGTGLGLVIVRSIVQAHHGTVTVATELGRGTEVKVTFARRLASAQAGDDGGRIVVSENEHETTDPAKWIENPKVSKSAA